MKSQQAVLNRVWSRLILEELSRLGVRDVCIAPGSRSTPLTLEADAHPALRLHPHFDERGLGYLALGLAKASQNPVAVIVTSGTAVANLLPCVAEANLTGEKLVLLTADRPAELIDCGANQAIEQQGIFSAHTVQAINLPSPTAAISPGWLLTTLDQALFHQSRVGGVVHINCPFPEPLYTQIGDVNDHDYLAGVQPWLTTHSPYSFQPGYPLPPVQPEPELFRCKGVVIIGSLPVADAEKARDFAQMLGWPVLCDPQSGVGSDWACFDLWLQHETCRKVLSGCELIIQFGARLVSKRLNQWLQQQVAQQGSRYLYISPCDQRNNPFHLPQQHLVTPTDVWIDVQTVQYLAQGGDSASVGWADELLPLIHRIPVLTKQVIGVDRPLCEIEVAMSVATLAPAADLFIGNSLIVRLIDMFCSARKRAVYSNRGASGIDGIVATAAGIQRDRQQPMLLLLGDTSLLYDLNSLALLTRTCQPFVVVVINNDGGAIFDLLPVPPEQKTDLYQMPHGYHFAHAAAQFGLGYENPRDLTAFQQCINRHIENGNGGLIVEVSVPAGQAAQQITQVVNDVRSL